MAEYSAERRIGGIRPLGAVTKNEAAESTDLDVLQRWERLREAIADERREAAAPRRSFADLLGKKPG